MKLPSTFALALLLCSVGTATAQSPRPWQDYRTILWMGAQAQKHRDHPKLPDRLREMGINTGMVGAGGNPQWLTDAGFGHYVENMITKGLCLKFRSNVTNWNKFVDDWKIERSEAGLVRDYSLEDPKWRNEALGEMRRIVTHHKPFKPLMYDIRDELSVTVSANPFDYDFSPVSLAGFREWLKTQYPSLQALNDQWATTFAAWDDVKPFTTDQIKHRIGTGEAAPAKKVDWHAARNAKFDPLDVRKDSTRWNFSPWMDHRTYMDSVLAKTLADLRQVAREIDPETPVGIEGTQMPHAFGGYDLWRMSQVLDWVEPYDICNSREIFGSFMPGKPILATVFEKDTLPAQRRLWHLLLEGDKGCIIWWSEDVIDWAKPDLPLTPKGQALSPVMKQLNSPLAKLFLLAKRERDPIAIQYSHPSIQVAWLLETIPDGATWLRRFSSYESDHNRHAALRNAWLKAFQDFGFSPIFLSSAEIEEGALKERNVRVLAMPRTRAMSDREEAGISDFLKGNAHIICGQDSGRLFDQHGAPKPPGPLARVASFEGSGVFAHSDGPADAPLRITNNADTESHLKDRLSGKANVMMEVIPAILDHLKLQVPVTVPPAACVRVHRYTAGPKARLLAFERNIEYKMREELAQAGGNEALEKPLTFTATLKEPGFVVNLRTGEKLGQTAQIQVALDPWLPALFAVLPDEPQGDVVEKLLMELNSKQ